MNADKNLRSTYDAVVVGARCAGAATAMLLARRGLVSEDPVAATLKDRASYLCVFVGVVLLVAASV